MHVNADLSSRALVEPQMYRWVASPETGIERVMLDRWGGEVARATSLVRYAPGARFPAHQHPGGEEILVLSGAFSEGDEHCPQGWYLRNPPGSSHQPFSIEGTTIFVKLRQMSGDEHDRVRINTNDPARWTFGWRGASCLLFQGQAERVSLERLRPGALVPLDALGGTEILILDGGLREHTKQYAQGSWIRLPAGELPRLTAASQGATLYIKAGHLGTRSASGGASC